MRYIFYLLCFFIFIVSSSVYAQESCCDKLRNAGIEAYNKGDYADAIKKWEAAKGCATKCLKDDLDSKIKDAKAKLDGKKPVNKSTSKPKPSSVAAFEPKMIFVKGGTFIMGCENGGCSPEEKPAHSVTIKDFYIGKYEVTQIQWRSVMGNNPPELYNKGCNQCPVESVAWEDVELFIKELNIKTGKKYRLPTEAEWEYAARGGNKSKGYNYAGSNDVDSVAWYIYNYYFDNNYGTNKTTRLVGSKMPNELGIYDMSGNVSEWTQDCYHENYDNAPPDGSAWVEETKCIRVYRGGNWESNEYPTKVFFRQKTGQKYDRYAGIGFRLAQDK